VVENFDFEELPGSNEVTGDFYVRFRWRWITTRVRMLCGAPVYVQSMGGGTDVNSFRRDGGGRIYFHGWMRY
jgi:hypothetical protein